MDALEEEMFRLAYIDPASDDGNAASHAQMLRLLFKSYFQDNALLPIGTYASRLLFLETPGRVGWSVRTYASHAAPATPDPAYPSRHAPRYNYRFWTLPGGEAESDMLRRACGSGGSARPMTTRIIDFAGRPDLPFAVRGTSYLCGFLGSDLAVVLPWGIDRVLPATIPRLSKRFAIA